MATSLNQLRRRPTSSPARSALFEDLNFSTAREWKAAKPGRKVIGYMPIYVPRELIHAAGMLPLGIVGGGDQLEVIHGDAYYQSYICRIPRSTIELGVSGRLDFVDGMLFPSICDVIRNLSGMWKMMFPAMSTRSISTCRRTIATTSAAISTSTRWPSCATISASCAASRSPTTSCATRSPSTTKTADWCASSTPSARQKPWQAPAAEVYLMVRAGLVLPAEEHTVMLRDYLAAARAEERPMRDNCRIVLTGIVLRAAAAQSDQVARTVRLLRGRRRSAAGHPLAHRRRRDQGRSAAQSFRCLPASLGVDGGQIRTQQKEKGQHLPRGQDAQAPKA